MSGPLNITKHRTTADEFTLRWTPLHEDIGNYFPICFAVEFKSGSTVYQTEMRCVLVNVTKDLVKTVVTCHESSMIVEVEKATLPRIHFDHLQLSDPSNRVCSLQTHSNSTHIVAIVPLNACGTQIEEDEENLLFKNEITTVDDPSAIITRRHQVEMKFYCQYAKKGNVTFTFSAHRDNVTVWDKGFGKLTYEFEFYPTQRFDSRIDPRFYPLEYDVGDRIYMEIEATTTATNTELFVESCVAAPYDIANYPHPYILIENGCNKDPTLIVYARNNVREFKFSIEAFKFIGLHDQVYISCSVLMCEAGNPNTRCSRGCQPNGSRRSRREAAIQSGTHYVSQGPLRLKRSLEAENSGMNLNLNLVFITGCALAAMQERQQSCGVDIMFSTTVVVLQLLWLSLASASHFLGGTVTFRSKIHSDGNYGVELRHKATFRNCQYLYGGCYGNNCGYNRQIDLGEDNEYLLFKNEITTVDDGSALVTTRHQVEMKFYCHAHRDNVIVWDKGLGKLTYEFEFYPTQQFASRIDPRLYPLEYDVGDRIYMEIEATTTATNTELFVESCTAAPYDTANYPHPYILIENGCNQDPTLIVYARSNSREFKFSIEAFKFIGLHDQVYISCKVLMCEAGNRHTRCSRGCQRNGSRRSRREAAIQSGTHYVSQGPLRLKRSVAAENSGLNFNLNLVFITGCALAAVGMICGVLFYKVRKSSVKYQPLSSNDH
ncbi:hypothetical protein WMY93_000582 [Mugilogobius chulae]|uniref:ZP domain-containing protein n=1 Tax=Mugilogobius chulae TaxID=88201 RepID=A0AAW0QEM3_9GOBI